MDFQGNVLDDWIKRKMGVKPRQSFSSEIIKDYQFKKLAEVLAYVSESSPFYRKHLKGYQINKIKNLKDLASLPFTKEEDLKKFGLQMLCVSQSEIKRVVTLDTSGTTDKPKRIYFTPADQELTIDYFKQGMATFALPEEKVLILLPGERPGSIGDLLSIALRDLGLQPIKFGIGHTLGDILSKLIETQAEVIVGIPTHLLALAKYYEQFAKKTPLNLKKILLSTDYIAQSVIDGIKNIWDCMIYRYYAMTEMGLGGGIECQNHSGYHLYEGDFLFEIVDPKTRVVLPKGEYGEVAFTTLTRKGMPLIRYQTGDIARFTVDQCPCGSVLTRLDYIKARKKEIIPVGKDSSLSIGNLDEMLLAQPGVIDFIASISLGKEPFLLKIEITTLENSLDFIKIKTALKNHLATRFLLEQDRIQLTVKKIADPIFYQPKIGKRRFFMEDPIFVKEGFAT